MGAQLALALAVAWLCACAAPGGQVTPITSVTASPTAGGILVEWTGGVGAASFVVYRATGEGGLEEIAIVPGDRVSYADYSVEQGAAYRYAVAATGPGAPPEPVGQTPDQPVSPFAGKMLTLVLDGDGIVHVDGAAAPVTCVADCVVGFEDGASAVLRGEGEGESLSFAGFSSPCPPTAECELVMSEDRQLVALFRTHVLRVTLEGGAAFRTTAAPTDDRGVDECEVQPGNDCLLGYTYSGGPTLKVSLNVTVTEPGATFVGFGGACDDPQGSFCVVDVNGATEVIVRAAVPPTAVDDTYRAPQGGQLSVDAPGVLANDDAAEGATAELLGFDGQGQLDLEPDGSFTYDTANDGLGTVSFTYRVVGPLGLTSGPATVTIQMAPRPVANADTYSVNEDATLSVPGPGRPSLLENDENAAGATAKLEAAPSSGVLELAEDGGFTFTPEPDFNGTVTFTYRAVGELGMESEPGTVTIHVLPVNDPPSFTLTTTEVTAGPGQVLNIPGFAGNIHPGGGPDESSQVLTFVIDRVTGPFIFADPTINANNGMLSFRAPLDPLFTEGTITFRVVLNDDGGTANGGKSQSLPATFDIVLTRDPQPGDDSVGGGDGDTADAN